ESGMGIPIPLFVVWQSSNCSLSYSSHRTKAFSLRRRWHGEAVTDEVEGSRIRRQFVENASSPAHLISLLRRQLLLKEKPAGS
ncbi:MAG: hypothetical protein IJ357_00710, partial [Oscillospiraceae bacterium]|nr:hypothetical protein [Oscillospiraceae bacterium]